MPLRDYTERRQFPIFGEFTDIGYSGSKERRPQLDLLMSLARKHQFDAVLVARFDRFARSTKHLLTALGEFDALGIHFISLNENIDTSTAMGRLVFTILAAVAEMERAIIRERVLSGVDRARRQGKPLGRPRVIVDAVKLQELALSGRSIRSLSLQFGISRATVNSVLRHVNKPLAQADLTH